MEEWRDIEGYEGLYQVSNLGRVKSLNFNHTKKERVLKGNPDKDGYLRVTLFKNGRKTYRIHQLVALVFIPNPNNYPVINHKNENPSDNRVENLEWCTIAYNNCYGNRLKRVSEANKISMKGKKTHLGIKHTDETKNKISFKNKGKLAYNRNPKAKKVRCITTGEEFGCIKEAAEKYNVTPQCIRMCCQGKYKTSGKLNDGTRLIWKYL